MFGFGKNKEVDVRLTERQLCELKKNMSRSELKNFDKKQRRAQKEREWNAMMMAEIFMDDV